MAKINILPSKVYNRIAAGEVVDRPSSVVKELIENAIDAGATEIEIYVEKGGKQLIRVVDNGCGIERDDLQSAFLPHATSKIQTAEDLNNILTLGFRGEAVASISAVSKMTIISQTENGKCYKLSCDGGELGQITEMAGAKGTDVSVEMLFYHTPVRLGFLKSDKAEETDITTLVSRFILNRSDIAFTYYVDGKKSLQSFGGGDEEAMACVYGASVLAECFAIDAQKHGIRIRGYIGNQSFSKSNKSYQSIFLNGRHILNTTISAAISNAYASYLMKRQYPFYVLHIDVPTEIVDVNVHPNKADVRFADNQIVYGCIYSVISAILDGQSKGMEYVVKMPTTNIYAQAEEEPSIPPKPPVHPPEREKEENLIKRPAYVTYEEAQKEIEKSAPVFTAAKRGEGWKLPFEDVRKKEESTKYPGFISVEELQKPHSDKIFVPDENAEPMGPLIDLGEYSSLAEDSRFRAKEKAVNAEADPFLANKLLLEQMEENNRQNRIDISTCFYAGKLFNTYLLYEQGDCVYIIDQHAAHERLLFDKLRAKMETRKCIRQPMLMPYTIQLNNFESGFIRENFDNIQDMGFTLCEKEKNIFEISEVPQDLQSIDVNSFIHGILAEVNQYRAIKLENLVRDKLASQACKAAVKGGMDLSHKEIEALFKMMDGDIGLKCPHGRPVVVKMLKREIEKKFKRIL